MVKKLKKFIPVLCCFVILASFVVPASAATFYSVALDGDIILTYSSAADSVQLHVQVYSDSCYFYFESAYDDGFDMGYSNDDYQMFAGLSKYSTGQQVEYSPGSDGPVYTIELFSGSPSINLYSVYKYPLTIRPNGGTWNGSSQNSVIWDLPTSYFDEIVDPFRSGYEFTGWTLTGGGVFDAVGDPPYSYTFGTSPGYLDATWKADSSVSSYSTIVHIGSNSYTFIAQGFSPNVTLTDLGTSLQLSDGISTFNFPYPADLIFEGFSFSPDGNPFLSPGGSYVIQGASASNSIFTIYPLFSSDASDSHYSLTINIFNSTGTTLYRTFSASSVSSPLSPTATMYPIAAGLSVDVGTGARWTWLDAQEGFIGFSDRPYSSTARYAAGGTYYIGGEEKDTILNLYVVYQDSPASPVGVDFVSWLGDAVGGFLDFELWPGLSLNDLLWVILVMGILFAFLKMTV